MNTRKLILPILIAVSPLFAFAQSGDSAMGGPMTSAPLAKDNSVSSAPIVLHNPRFSCVVYTYHKPGYGYAENVISYGSNTNDSKVIKPSTRVPGWHADVYQCTGPNF